MAFHDIYNIVSYSPKIYLSKVNYLLQEGFKFDHLIVFIDVSDFYDDTNFYSIDQNLKVTEKYSEKKNLKRRKFLRNNFPLTNFYMFVLKKYKFRSEHRKKLNINESEIADNMINMFFIFTPFLLLKNFMILFYTLS